MAYAGERITAMKRIAPGPHRMVSLMTQYIQARQTGLAAMVQAIQRDQVEKAKHFKAKWAEAAKLVEQMKAESRP